MTLTADKKDPIERMDPADPTPPMESTEPTDPTDKTELREPMDRTESRDHSDHREPASRPCTDPFFTLESLPASHLRRAVGAGHRGQAPRRHRVGHARQGRDATLRLVASEGSSAGNGGGLWSPLTKWGRGPERSELIFMLRLRVGSLRVVRPAPSTRHSGRIPARTPWQPFMQTFRRGPLRFARRQCACLVRPPWRAPPPCPPASRSGYGSPSPRPRRRARRW